MFDASILLHVAALVQVTGFMVIDQLRLRLLVLLGSSMYITYYLTLDPPLFTAMFWSTVMALANSVVIVKLLLDRTTLNLSAENLALYKVFDCMTPGEFRRLLKIVHWQDGTDQALLTTEGEPVERLFYVTQGPIGINKMDKHFNIAGGVFVGEVAFFLRTPASATVTVDDKARYVCWSHDDLMALQQKEPGIRAALHSILNKDMAAKVARSMGLATIA